MVNFFTKLTEFFMKFAGRLDGDGSGGIDFFEMLTEPGMPSLAEKLGRFSWASVLELIAASIVLGVVLLKIRRHDVGTAAAVLIAVGTGYLAGRGVMTIALIIMIPLAFFIWQANDSYN